MTGDEKKTIKQMYSPSESKVVVTHSYPQHDKFPSYDLVDLHKHTEHLPVETDNMFEPTLLSVDSVPKEETPVGCFSATASGTPGDLTVVTMGEGRSLKDSFLRDIDFERAEILFHKHSQAMSNFDFDYWEKKMHKLGLRVTKHQDHIEVSFTRMHVPRKLKKVWNKQGWSDISRRTKAELWRTNTFCYVIMSMFGTLITSFDRLVISDDIYKAKYATLGNIPYDQVTKEQRSQMKQTTFLEMYSRRRTPNLKELVR
jgi:hypothetical protein